MLSDLLQEGEGAKEQAEQAEMHERIRVLEEEVAVLKMKLRESNSAQASLHLQLAEAKREKRDSSGRYHSRCHVCPLALVMFFTTRFLSCFSSFLTFRLVHAKAPFNFQDYAAAELHEMLAQALGQAARALQCNQIC